MLLYLFLFSMTSNLQFIFASHRCRISSNIVFSILLWKWNSPIIVSLQNSSEIVRKMNTNVYLKWKKKVLNAKYERNKHIFLRYILVHAIFEFSRSCQINDLKNILLWKSLYILQWLDFMELMYLKLGCRSKCHFNTCMFFAVWCYWSCTWQ